MAAHDHAATARALNEAYNARNWDAAAALVTADAQLTNVATGQTFSGQDGARLFLQGWAEAFPDSRVETTAVVADERAGAMEFVGRGTQTGPLHGPAGTIPPTGRRVEVRFCQALEFEGGKVRAARLYFDAAGMLAQLGLLPPPPGA